MKKYILCFFLLLIINLISREVLAMEITSSAFINNNSIPSKYTCDGVNISPELKWSNVPKAAKSIVLIMDDPDAPVNTWTHWVLYNLPPDMSGLSEDIKKFPPGTMHGRNSWSKTGYGGPCPPSNEHGYVFTLYALDTTLSFSRPPDSITLQNAMKEHILDKAILIGKYKR